MSTSDHEAVLERLREKAQHEEELPEDPSLEEESSGGEEPAEETEEAKKSSVREYVIALSPKEVGRVEASSAKSALEILGKTEGDFIVVPVRNWNTFSIKTETTTVTHVTPQ